MNKPDYIIIGNPENRRVTDFVRELIKQGHNTPIVVSHQSILKDASCLADLPDKPYLVRIDATGENPHVEHALLQLGFGQASQTDVSKISPEQLSRYDHQHGEVLCPRQHHFGFIHYLQQLQGIFTTKTNWFVLNPPGCIIELFDKRSLLPKYETLGLPVADTITGTAVAPITDMESLQSAMRECNCNKVFIKLSSGSSASCLALYQRTENDHDVLMTTLRKINNKWFNSLKIQRITRPDAIKNVVSFLLQEGSRLERAIPKARLENAFMDCRILLINGEPHFTVIRQNTHPITNLHLGGWRGDNDIFQQNVDADTWQHALASCRHIGRLHSCFHLGIDLLFEPGFKKHRIIEVNAFGDLLPNLFKNGLSVYGYQIAAATQLTAQNR